MDKALNYLGLARKAGLAELGEEPAGAAARAQHARLIIVASDASDHTWRRALSFVAGTSQLTLRVPLPRISWALPLDGRSWPSRPLRTRHWRHPL